MWNGTQVIASDLLVQDKLHMRERKWAHRKMWKREKRFNVTVEQVPYVMFANGVMYAHPDIIEEIKKQVPAEHVNAALRAMYK